MSDRSGAVAPAAVDGHTRPAAGRASSPSRFERPATLALRVAHVAVLTVALLLYGSVEPWPLTLVAGAMAGICGLAILLRGEPPAARAAFRLAAATALALAAFALLQSVPLPPGFPAHPLWTEAGGLVDPVSPAISAAPALTRFSLLWALTPFAGFLAALVLWSDDEAAVGLLATLGWVGGLYAVMAVAQEVLAPDRLLFEAKANYIGSLTAPFVNRNTAATFYAAVSMVLAALLVLRPRERERTTGTTRSAGWRPRWPRHGRAAALWGLLGTALVALLLTNSRGGIGAAIAGFLVLAPILATGAGRRRSDIDAGPSARRRTLVRIAVAIAAVPLFALVFAGRTELRFASAGLDDQRFCILPGLFAAARDTPLFGSGLGTFADSFAPFRDAACGPHGIWYRAHDSYLESAITLGLPATLGLLAAAACLAAMLVRGVRQRARLRPVAGVGLAVTVLVAVHALVDFSLQIPGFALYAASVLAAAATAALGRPSNARQKAAQTG